MDSGVKWDLSPLAGPHKVWHSYSEAPKTANWTFTLDICDNLKRNKDKDENRVCPQGTMSKLSGLSCLYALFLRRECAPFGISEELWIKNEKKTHHYTFVELLTNVI